MVKVLLRCGFDGWWRFPVFVSISELMLAAVVGRTPAVAENEPLASAERIALSCLPPLIG